MGFVGFFLLFFEVKGPRWFYNGPLRNRYKKLYRLCATYIYPMYEYKRYGEGDDNWDQKKMIHYKMNKKKYRFIRKEYLEKVEKELRIKKKYVDNKSKKTGSPGESPREDQNTFEYQKRDSNFQFIQSFNKQNSFFSYSARDVFRKAKLKGSN